jgi:hypothetical protein
MTIIRLKGHDSAISAVAVFVVLACFGFGRPGDLPQDLAKADELFHRGEFDGAARIYEQAAEKSPSSYEAVMGMSRIAVLRNALDEAEGLLKRAIALKPQEQEPQRLLGETLCRKDAYFQAAPYFEAVGRKAKAEMLQAFRDKTPFEIESGPDISSLPFIRTDPLPVIRVTVNGQEGQFLIDTGGWDLHVMPAFAAKCGLEALPEKETGTYAGGRQAASSSAVADRVGLGEFELRNVPVVIPERSGPFQVDGIVGTVVLDHFLFTLDYPGGRLILRRNTPEMSKDVRAAAERSGAMSVPFWLAGDHFIFAWGTVNGAGPYLFLVDTGMAGGGFDCPEFVVKEAHIELPKQGFQGMGGGGPVTVYPFTADLTLGGARRDKVRGLYGALPPGFGERLGFRTGGLISHGFFRPFAVTFDFQAMTIYLKKAEG